MLDIEEPRKVSNHWSYMDDTAFDKFMYGFLRFISFKSIKNDVQLKLVNDLRMHSVPFEVNWINENIDPDFHMKFPYKIPKECDYDDLPDDPTIRPTAHHIWKFKVYDVVVDVLPYNIDMIRYTTDGFDAYVVLPLNDVMCLNNNKLITYRDLLDILIGIHNKNNGGKCK